ncbi:MAG: ubiquinone/menaquinone biosynthesis methyltransferase [Thermoplasmata archaeon]|nr:ubiquinone/menaquinone biosynthesis methyltransferase [Thermoplasmata archaeon]
MAGPRASTADRVAADGSPYPDRARPSFEHDVRAMFTHIAHRYDWFDHLVSFGQDFVWRPRALWALDRFRDHRPVHRVLDVGCGPGDLTVLAGRRFPSASVVGADFTAAMLARAATRHDLGRFGPRLRFAQASAMHLPFRSASFDVVMSAFVVRNLVDLGAAFRELRRVLVPGGSLLTLEITEPTSRIFRATFHTYFDRVVPWLGAAVHSAGPYRYLPESLRDLPGRASMLAMLADAGFSRTIADPLSLGAVTSYLAEAAPSHASP